MVKSKAGFSFDTFFYSLYCCLFIFYEHQVYWADA